MTARERARRLYEGFDSLGLDEITAAFEAAEDAALERAALEADEWDGMIAARIRALQHKAQQLPKKEG